MYQGIGVLVQRLVSEKGRRVGEVEGIVPEDWMSGVGADDV
jgi:hypothetical protein